MIRDTVEGVMEDIAAENTDLVPIDDRRSRAVGLRLVGFGLCAPFSEPVEARGDI